VRRNLVTNPSFELGTSGYVADPAVTATRVTGGYSGTYAMQLKSAGGAKNGAAYAVSVEPDSTYTLSTWIRLPADVTAGYGMVVDLYDPDATGGTIDGGSPSDSSVNVIDGNGTDSDGLIDANDATHVGYAATSFDLVNATDWTQLSLTFTAPPTATSAVLRPVTTNEPAAAGDTVILDAVLLETGSIAGAYFDGATPESYTNGFTQPLLVDGWEESAETRTKVNAIIGGGIDYVLYPASLRSGQFVAVYEDESDAAAAFRMHQQAAQFTIEDTDRPSIGMSYIVNGTIARALDDESREYWLVTVPFQEVDA
jgi:hypothetical protein